MTPLTVPRSQTLGANAGSLSSSLFLFFDRRMIRGTARSLRPREEREGPEGAGSLLSTRLHCEHEDAAFILARPTAGRWCDRRESTLSASGSAQRPKALSSAGGAPPCCLPSPKPAARCASCCGIARTETRSLDTSRRRARRSPSVEALDEQHRDLARPKDLGSELSREGGTRTAEPEAPSIESTAHGCVRGWQGIDLTVESNEFLTVSVPACLGCLWYS